MKKRRPFDQINVIPFIDIMLVLLVMVLTTATFIRQGVIPVELPKSSAQENVTKKEEIIISIDKAGMFYIAKEKLEFAQLKARLQNISPDQPVVLNSDKAAAFEHFVQVMDLLKAHNHEALYIQTAVQ